jgi:hypothetical protein
MPVVVVGVPKLQVLPDTEYFVPVLLVVLPVVPVGWMTRNSNNCTVLASTFYRARYVERRVTVHAQKYFS